MPLTRFQQVVLRHKVTTATEEELNTLREFINTHFKEENGHCKCPWEALRVDDAQPEVDLERQYVNE